MLFNSFDFAIFLPIVFALYWFAAGKNRQLQNAILVIASYIFYGWWDWRFLGLILFSTVVDYLVGLALGGEERPQRRKLYIVLSILVNLGFLGVFKYANFFLDNLQGMFSFLGWEISLRSLKIILPVGLSFYTFQALSYTIDVYRRKLEPTRDFLVYATYVAFFPQLVAGPIERATHLLPQFQTDRAFDYRKAVDGMRQMLWGLFKKVVVADNCAVYANQLFNGAGDYSGSTILLGAVFFAFQIYGDFSGYSDIAIGVARLFGFNLMKNFAFPYFSRDIAEFWRRWHISLTTWFRDYLYFPLGGSREGKWKTIRNTVIIFLVSGFWHGAKWTFLIWGALNALYFIPLLLRNKNRTHLDTVASGRAFPTVAEAGQMALTFGLAVFAWIFFRAEDLGHLSVLLGKVFSLSVFSVPQFFGRLKAFQALLWVGAMLVMEWLGRENEHALERFASSWPRVLRWGFYYVMIYSILLFMGSEQQFIYFQF